MVYGESLIVLLDDGIFQALGIAGNDLPKCPITYGVIGAYIPSEASRLNENLSSPKRVSLSSLHGLLLRYSSPVR